MTARRVGLGAAVLLLAGCNPDPVYFTDDVDLSFDFVQQLLPMFPGEDLTHGPYVAGSSFTMFVNTQRSTQSMAEWTAASSDGAVFVVDAVTYTRGEGDDHDWLAVDVTLVGDGEAELLVLDADRVVDSATIDARVPDRAELHAAAPLFVDTGDLVPTAAPSPRILTGGEATYEVRWFDGEERLNGHGALEAVGDAGVYVETEQTWLFEDRDWIHVFPQQDGPSTIALSSFGFPVQDVTIEGVPPEAVVQVAVFGEDERGAQPEQWLALMAEASDAQGDAIHGVDFVWDRDGAAEYGVGDLYRYEFDPAATVEMQASFGDVASDVVRIHAAEGYVDSSNNVGCDVSGRYGTFATLAGLLLLRRRR